MGVVTGVEGLHRLHVGALWSIEGSYRVHVGGIQDNIGSVLIMTSIMITSSFRGRDE